MRNDSESPEHNKHTPSTIEDERIPESKKFNNQKLDRDYQININLIAQTSLDNTMTNALSQQQKIQRVLQLRSIHLEWLNIKRIQNLQVFQKLNVLYLQHNKIKKIEHLDCLINLEYLALNDNMIVKVQNLKHLNKLQGLNLNNNQIQDFEMKEIPVNIQLLSFKNNPVTLDANYKKDLIKGLKLLEVLDDIVISPQEKIKAIGKFPLELLQYSQQMNHFRQKKQIQKSLSKKQQPVLLGAAYINQKQIEKQIKQKTQNYMKQNQEVFKEEQNDQIENFEQKIVVSKNIRHIKQEEEKNRRQRLEDIRLKKLEQIDREIQQIKKAVKATGRQGVGSPLKSKKIQQNM